MKKIYKIIINSALSLLLCAAILVLSPFADTRAARPTAGTPDDTDADEDAPEFLYDFNKNGKPDAIDIMEGARADAENMPTYNDQYYPGGYPPDDVGVCADVIWRAFRQAGYDLKKMIDTDIKNRPEAYTDIEKPDPDIDFRRVVNLLVFFRTCSPALTIDISQVDEWQPGDIAVFGNRLSKPVHIGIISDIRAEDGTPYLIHNSGQPVREENAMPELSVIAHFRFDASMISPDMIFPWE